MLEPANTNTTEEKEEILETWISEHPSVMDPDRLGGRRAILGQFGLSPRRGFTPRKKGNMAQQSSYSEKRKLLD